MYFDSVLAGVGRRKNSLPISVSGDASNSFGFKEGLSESQAAAAFFQGEVCISYLTPADFEKHQAGQARYSVHLSRRSPNVSPPVRLISVFNIPTQDRIVHLSSRSTELVRIPRAHEAPLVTVTTTLRTSPLVGPDDSSRHGCSPPRL